MYRLNCLNPSKLDVIEVYKSVNQGFIMFWTSELHRCRLGGAGCLFTASRHVGYRGPFIFVVTEVIGQERLNERPPGRSIWEDRENLRWRKLNLGPWREFWKPMYFPPPWGPLRNDTSGLLSLVTQVERTMAEIPNDYSFLVFPQKLHTPLLRKSVFELAARAVEDIEEPWYTRQAFFLEREPRILHESVDPSTVEYHEHTDSQGVIHRWETGIKSVAYDLSRGKVVEIHNFMASNAVRYTREQEAFAKRQALQRGYQGSFE